MTDINKQHHKLVELQNQAEHATNRDEAQRILKAAAKAQRKITEANNPFPFR
jgi:hypothetical protein